MERFWQSHTLRMLPWMLSNYVSSPTPLGAATIREARNAGESATMLLENRVESLELACAGLWQLLKSKHGYTDDDLVAAVTEVDAKDGKVDGKLGRPVADATCPHCGRNQLTRRAAKCSWCGLDLGRAPL